MATTAIVKPKNLLAGRVLQPNLSFDCGDGVGMVASSALKLVATSEWVHNTISVHRLTTKGFRREHVLGGFQRVSHGRCQMNHMCLATLDVTNTVVLFAVDTELETVHVINACTGTHGGFVGEPGSLHNPHGVAATSNASLVAVACTKGYTNITVFERECGGDHMWARLRVIDWGSWGYDGAGEHHRVYVCPRGLRFSKDNTRLAITSNTCMRVLDVNKIQHAPTTEYSVQQFTLRKVWGSCRDVEAYEVGWLVVRGNTGIVQMLDHDFIVVGQISGFQNPTAVAMVPGWGMLVRDGAHGGRVQVFSTAQEVTATAMMLMSEVRVAWMVAVWTGILAWHGLDHIPARNTPCIHATRMPDMPAMAMSSPGANTCRLPPSPPP